MKYFEASGDSPESIIEQFIIEKDIPKDFITYIVLDNGAKGVLGIGKKLAKIKIEYHEEEHIKKYAKLILSEMLDLALFPDHRIESNILNSRIFFNIDTDTPELLIGRQAQTLDAIQYLFEKMLKLDIDRDFDIIVDVNNYRERMSSQLIEKAKSMADEVIRTGRPQKMQPLSASMRKEIHIALKEIDGVTTLSIGDTPIKQISIMPDKKNKR